MKQVSKLKYKHIITEDKKPFNLGQVDYTNKAMLFHHILDNMASHRGDIMVLTGGTGIGKTAGIKQLGVLLGMDILAIEVPHIVSEAVVNIPFVKYRDEKIVGKSGEQINVKKPDVVLATSYLVDQLKTLQRSSPQQYEQSKAKWPADLQEIYTNFPKFEKDRINLLRTKYRGILFLDEYWREVETDVRNILRSILERMVGQDRIPNDIYIIAASNMQDIGNTVEKPSGNQVYRPYPYPAQTKDQFLKYIMTYSKQPIKNEVLHAFNEVLKDEHFDYDDAESEIRTSSRRLTEVLRYVNAAVPVKSETDSKALLANVRAMFSDEEKQSSLYRLFDSAVRQIIKETNADHPEWSNVKPNEKTNWKDTLEHQIRMKMKLGDDRKYVPIISGRPGIGKTSHMQKIAEDLNLILVRINCQGLQSSEVTGLPLKKEEEVTEAKKSNTTAVTFSAPKLWISIENQMEKEKEEFLKKLNPQEKQKWEAQPFHYLLFFDEINRPHNQNAFNSLRRLILEKEFNENYHLPKDVVVVAAMNPKKYDDKVLDLTQHMKDAVDLIDTAPSWSGLMQHFESMDNSSLQDYPSESKEIAKNIIKAFAEKYAHTQENIKASDNERITKDSLPFFLRTSGDGDEQKPEDSDTYLSPRDYDHLYKDLVTGITTGFHILQSNKSNVDAKEFFPKYLWPKIRAVLQPIFDKTEQNPKFLKDVETWLEEEMENFLVSTRSKPSLDNMLNLVITNKRYHLTEDPNWIRYMDQYHPNSFHEDLQNFMIKLMSNEEKKYHIFAKTTQSQKQRDEEKIKVLKEGWSALEAIAWEIHDAVEDHSYSNDALDILGDVIINVVENAMEDLVEPEKGTQEYKDYENLIWNIIPQRINNIKLKRVEK